RLPQNFLQLWDHWLQDSVAASRAQLGDKWLDIYLNSPIWRFVLMPGVCGPKAWTGVIMPSVDKVGRYFPFTIAHSVEAHSDFLVAIFRAQHWFDEIEQIALSALDVEFSLDNLEQALAAHTFPAHYSEHEKNPAAKQLAERWLLSQSQTDLQLPSLDGMAKLIQHASLDLFAMRGAGRSIWWRNQSNYGAVANGPVKWRDVEGLPSCSLYGAMLQGG
ncbi:MAG TPA: type VI secretion system-associated protein TagF, partial [Pseudomonadales bacterium]|nr:type VI secretion system-associated protein TagF [Pseudomonadales bacterium]